MKVKRLSKVQHKRVNIDLPASSWELVCELLIVLNYIQAARHERPLSLSEVLTAIADHYLVEHNREIQTRFERVRLRLAKSFTGSRVTTAEAARIAEGLGVPLEDFTVRALSGGGNRVYGAELRAIRSSARGPQGALSGLPRLSGGFRPGDFGAVDQAGQQTESAQPAHRRREELAGSSYRELRATLEQIEAQAKRIAERAVRPNGYYRPQWGAAADGVEGG